MNDSYVSNAGNRIKYVGARRFALLPELKYDVRSGRAGDVVFPAGTKNVWVSFRTSHIHAYVESTGKVQPLNVYMKGTVVVHG